MHNSDKFVANNQNKDNWKIDQRYKNMSWDVKTTVIGLRLKWPNHTCSGPRT